MSFTAIFSWIGYDQTKCRTHNNNEFNLTFQVALRPNATSFVISLCLTPDDLARAERKVLATNGLTKGLFI